MRDYSKVSPKFWIGKTGKALRKKGPEAVIVGMYLMTAPTANMLGLYYLTIGTIAHETGLGFEGASKGLQSAIEAGFCSYDEESEVVWVFEMASYQVGEALKENDLRVKGVQNEYDALPENPYLAQFFDKYAAAFHMASKRNDESPLQAPSKPLRSQEQEQEQEQKQEQEQEQEHSCAPAGGTPPKKDALSAEKQQACRKTWDSYSDAYVARYGTEPVRNAKVNRNIVDFVGRLGGEEAPHVAAFYVRHNGAYYVRDMHSVGAMLKDAEKLRTEWATNAQMTAAKAHQIDKTQTNYDAFAPLIAAAEAEESHVEG